jgi:hypothetical protein
VKVSNIDPDAVVKESPHGTDSTINLDQYIKNEQILKVVKNNDEHIDAANIKVEIDDGYTVERIVEDASVGSPGD